MFVVERERNTIGVDVWRMGGFSQREYVDSFSTYMQAKDYVNAQSNLIYVYSIRMG